MSAAETPERALVIDRGTGYDGWGGESSMRRQPDDEEIFGNPVARAAMRRVRLRAPAVRQPGEAPAPSEHAELVSLWQLAVMTSRREAQPKGKRQRRRQTASEDPPAGREWPPLLELVEQARNGQGIARRPWASAWVVQRLRTWQSLGLDGRKPLRWELLKARLIAGAECNGELRESRKRGFNHAFLLNASRLPISASTIQQRQDLRDHEALQRELDAWWAACPLSPDGTLARCVYYWGYGRAARLLLPDASPAEIQVLLLRDWEDDAAGRSWMGRDSFDRSFHQLLAVCCETPGAAETVEFAKAVRAHVFAEGLPAESPAGFKQFEITPAMLRQAVSELLAPLRPVQEGNRLPDARDMATISVRCLLLNAAPDAAVEQLDNVMTTGGLLHLPPPPKAAKAARAALLRSQRNFQSTQSSAAESPDVAGGATRANSPSTADDSGCRLVMDATADRPLQPLRVTQGRWTPSRTPQRPRRPKHAAAVADFAAVANEALARAAMRWEMEMQRLDAEERAEAFRRREIELNRPRDLELTWTRKYSTAAAPEDGESCWSHESCCSSDSGAYDCFHSKDRMFHFRSRDTHLLPGRAKEQAKARATIPRTPLISPKATAQGGLLLVSGDGLASSPRRPFLFPTRYGIRPETPEVDPTDFRAAVAAESPKPVPAAEVLEIAARDPRSPFRPLRRLVPLPARR
eukprot:TRINITY_DN56574_c0_g1_i1.p1 TRINITY_DN56574_c0_g1~~TRINITY_DN56574_c0_g1_i1.p1  ORF type:complete len:720 (+),score=244.06 TRINITY_DN56574_c0_g1_i1:82-2160(+)